MRDQWIPDASTFARLKQERDILAAALREIIAEIEKPGGKWGGSGTWIADIEIIARAALKQLQGDELQTPSQETEEDDGRRCYKCEYPILDAAYCPRCGAINDEDLRALEDDGMPDESDDFWRIRDTRGRSWR